MPVKQISVSLENVPGKLSEVSEYLGANGINIIAISVAEATDLSAVRFVANDPQKAINVLKSHGYSVKVKDVLAVEAPNHPGGLNAVLKPLKEANINVDDQDRVLPSAQAGVKVVHVDKMEEAIAVLKKNWVKMLNEELYSM